MVISFTPHHYYLTSPQVADTDLFCDDCACLLIFAERSNRTDKCLCEECDAEGPELHLSQSQSSASSVVSSSHFSLSGRPVKFENLRGDHYPRIWRQNNSAFIGCKYVNGAPLRTLSRGSGQAARLELLCLLLAKSSVIDENGIVTWSAMDKKEIEMPLKQFKYELQKDVGRLKRMVDASAGNHLDQDDIAGGDGDVVATALRAVASNLENKYDARIKKFGLKRPVIKEIVKELRWLADNHNEDSEFPWGLCGAEFYPFPTTAEWGEQSKKVKRQTGNVETLEKRVPNLSQGLEAVMAFVGCETCPRSNRGHRAPPQFVTNPQVGCSSRKTADFMLAALFEGLLCDPVVDDEDFYDFVRSEYEKEPTALSKKERMDALLSFLRHIKAIPKFYTPSFLKEFTGDLDASETEVRTMKDKYKESFGNHENWIRLQKERQQDADMVRLNVYCFYIHFARYHTNTMASSIILFKGGSHGSSAR